MPFVIAEPCIDVKDQACVSVCPVACIHFDAGKDRKLYIDPNECIDCGACEPACPVKAIYAELDLPHKWAKYEEIDASLVSRSRCGTGHGGYRESEGLGCPA